MIDSPFLSKIFFPDSNKIYECLLNDNSASLNRKNNKIKKTCSSCNKSFIYNHKCKKNTQTDFVHSDNAFEFSDDYFNEEFDGKRFDRNVLKTSDPILTNFYHKSSSEISNWLDLHENFVQKNLSKFTICHININSIFCKFSDIDKILRKRIYQNVFVQETRLGSHTPDSFISIIYYNSIRLDRQAGGGGLICYIDKAYVLSDVVKYVFFETLKFSISFNSKNKKKHTFISSFNPNFKFSNG